MIYRSPFAHVAFVVALGAACKQSTPPDPTPATPSVTKPSGADPLNEKMRHCPVTLAGVKTEIEDVDGGVRFVLGATSPEIITEAQKRARELAEFTTGRGVGQKHGDGKGGGFMRNCPVVTKDSTIVAANTDSGVTLTVTPNDPTKLDDLRKTARERLDRAPIQRATVVREEASAAGETRLYSGGVADLDGDGKLELVVGGFSAEDGGRRSTVRVYRQDGDSWTPLAEAGWDDGDGATIRNVEVADVDGDGKPDIVVLGKIGASSHVARARLAVFDLVDGKLAKRAESEWQHGQYTHGYGLAIGDVDGDHKLEIVTGGFQFDGTTETGYVRVWSMAKGTLALRAETTLDGQGASSMRVNDIAIGDLDGDGKADIVVAGRHGPLKNDESKEQLDKRREVGDLSVLGFAGDKLTIQTRASWAKGTSLRIRSIVAADFDGNHRDEIIAGGQYDADGKACLAMFALDGGKLVVRDDASTTTDGVSGEIKDLVVTGKGSDLRVLATGVSGEKPGRQGDVAAWRVLGGKLVRDGSVVSRNGDETRARSLVVVPGEHASILTIGHAKTDTRMVGQLLSWNLPKTL